MDRKALTSEYKQRQAVGGVFRITNTASGKCYLEAAPNIQAKQNSFSFMVSTNTCFHHKLKKDWDAFGGKSFTFEVLETLQKKEEQSHEAFLEDLQTLKQIWVEKTDTAVLY